MAKLSSKQPLVASLLDRLTNESPRGLRGSGQLISELKQSVAADLARLLNTRCGYQVCEPHQKQLDQSLFSYGLPDFSGVSWGNYESRNQLLKLVQNVLELHEPRLRKVRVTLPADMAENRDRTLRFRIEAELRVESMPEPVVFDAVQEITSARFQVRRLGT